MRLHNTLLNTEVITEEIKGEIKKYIETNDNRDKRQQQKIIALKVLMATL